jgi:cell wall-associated NlpC family hydrolase
VIREARSWIGTQYRHQHREKGQGVDCAGVLTGLGRNLGLTTFDVTNYLRFPDGQELLALCDAHMQRIPIASMRAGDAVVMRIKRAPQHLGILADYPLGGFTMIHADSQIGRVVETPMDRRWLDRIVAAFALPGVVD